MYIKSDLCNSKETCKRDLVTIQTNVLNLRFAKYVKRDQYISKENYKRDLQTVKTQQ